MGMFDWMTGTKRPADGVPPRAPQEVYQALLAVNRPDVPYFVRDGSPERVDLVAEWKIADAHWYGHFGHVTRVNKTLMRLDPSKHEVRTVDHEITVTWAAGTPRLTLGKEFQRGQINKVSYNATYGRDESGKLVKLGQVKFSTGALKPPLQQAVTNAGWTWRGVLLAKL